MKVIELSMGAKIIVGAVIIVLAVYGTKILAYLKEGMKE